MSPLLLRKTMFALARENSESVSLCAAPVMVVSKSPGTILSESTYRVLSMSPWVTSGIIVQQLPETVGDTSIDAASSASKVYPQTASFPEAKRVER